MNQDSLLMLLTIFVALVALSQIGQVVALILLQRRAKALQDQIEAFAPRVEAVLKSAAETLDLSRRQITEITAKTNEILDSTRSQIGKVEGLLTDVTSRAKTQLDRAEMVLDDTLSRVHETVAVLHNGVMRPIKEINGITTGIRAAITHIMKGGRPSVAQATQDEEMFI
jgi:ElaB/YqjD/DUF883 family membrane-anchored ribosome-binding protein